MFTGIVESTGRIVQIEKSAQNLILWVESAISHELKVDQSVAHDGICLTVEAVKNGQHKVTAVQETIEKTTISKWVKDTRINLERCMTLHGRIDGHMVQGHVDDTATCILKKEAEGSWLFRFEIDKKFAPLIVEKGSICINGTSLTVFDVSPTQFSVAIIPYTYHHTTIALIEVGTRVNVEFDIIGKYVWRNEVLRNGA
jgi:riboflavin synthase